MSATNPSTELSRCLRRSTANGLGRGPKVPARGREVLAHVRRDPFAFGGVFECLFADDDVVRMRAADALEKLARERPELFTAYRGRLLSDVAEIDQPSVQWHLAQILPQIRLTPRQRARGVAILKQNLERYDDWLVVNLTLRALTRFAHNDSQLRQEMIALLTQHRDSPRKSTARLATKLLAELSP